MATSVRDTTSRTEPNSPGNILVTRIDDELAVLPPGQVHEMARNARPDRQEEAVGPVLLRLDDAVGERDCEGRGDRYLGLGEPQKSGRRELRTTVSQSASP